MSSEIPPNAFEVDSTSNKSANVSDIKLRTADTVRLIFRPILIANSKDEHACVKGTFIYQRKGKSGDWDDAETIPLSTLKSGEGYKLELKGEELLGLFRQLHSLYDIYNRDGIPAGNKRYRAVSEQLERLSAMADADLSALLSANRRLGANLCARLLTWASAEVDPEEIVSRLTALDGQALRELNAAIGLSTLRVALAEWRANKDNANEEFWHRSLRKHSFVLESVFSWPMSIAADKAYVGGKLVSNKSGSLVDFLVRNRVTKNAGIIEIKTPSKPLLGMEYRDGVFVPSSDLAGGVAQVLKYRHTLQANYDSLMRGQRTPFEDFAPRCMVIIGDAKSELSGDSERRRSFEQYRCHLQGVEVVTFDELFRKTRRLVQVLEGAP